MAKQISALPTAPSTQRPATFNTEADAFVAALPTFVSEANALATEAATNAQRSEDANATAQSAKDAAQTSAQTASEAKEAAARSASEAESSAQAASEAKIAAATSAKEAKESAQAVAETKEELSGSLGVLEEMKKIVATGFIDDSKVHTNLTYSSKKIEADFAPKNESTGTEQKIYGKSLSAAGEASSIVVRDGSGYISSSTPKSEEFTPDHLVCVRGSDGKEKFVPLETIYKNVLEGILKENLSLRGYADIDIIESIAPLEGSWSSTEAKRLKNKNIFAYSPSDWGKAAVFTPSLEKVELAPPPGGENGYQVTRLIDDDNSIFAVPVSDRKLFKLIETSDSCSWEEVVLDKVGPMPLTTSGMPRQSLNKFLYLKGSDGKIYKFDGRGATKTDMNGSPSYISLDRADSSLRTACGFSEDSCYYDKSSSGVNKLSLKNLITTPIGISVQHGAVSDFENFAVFLIRGSSIKAISAILDIRKNKAMTIPRSVGARGGTVYDYTDMFIVQNFFFSSSEDIYILGEASAQFVKTGSSQKVIAKINKKMLAYYGIKI